MKKIGFTLAEVLITLAIIGVVAALTIPSVVANTQQQEFKTGLRKAVSVLNSAITMNMAIDGETPYENADIFNYLRRHMSVIKTGYTLADSTVKFDGATNLAFYTTDGMRFEFPYIYGSTRYMYLYEDKNINLRGTSASRWGCNKKKHTGADACQYCGSYGLTNNSDNTTTAPCLVVVDVNGDRKPFPKNASCYDRADGGCKTENVRKYGDPAGKKLTDTFAVMITDKSAVPYGQAAQKAMYEAQK